MALPYYTRLEIDALLENFQPSGGDTDPAPEPGEGGSVFYFDNYGQFPRPGETNSLYVDNSDGLIYIWDATITDYKEEGRTQIQSDWNEPDISSPAYIRNRPISNSSFKPFITRFTVVAGDTIELPIGSGFNYDFTVDWGDGSDISQINDGTSTRKSHTYTDAGTYDVKIKGTLGSYNWFTFGTSTNGRDKLVEIVQWGDIAWRDISFYMCTSLTTIPQTEAPNFLGVTSLLRVFSDCPITEVSSNLFKLAGNVIDFALAFTRTQITTIPLDFLKECQAAVRFIGFFKSTPVTTIPDGLFSGSINAKTFSAAFRDCPIDNIPENTFSSCILAEDFSEVFFQPTTGSTLTFIPENLFKYNKRATNFSQAFRYASSINTDVPAFWLDFPNATATQCFDAAPNITNLADIPTLWGGNEGVPMPPQEPVEMRAYWDENLQQPVWKKDDGTFVDATGTTV